MQLPTHLVVHYPDGTQRAFTEPFPQPLLDFLAQQPPLIVSSSTLQLQSNMVFGPETGVQSLRVNSPAGRNVDAVKIPSGASGATVRNLSVDCSGSKIASAVSVAGSKAKVVNVTQTGTGRVLTFSGATDLDADLIVGNNGRQSEYSIYAGGDATPNTNCRIRRFNLWVGAGDPALAGSGGQQHGVRCHNHRLLILGDEKLRLPDMPQWSFYVKDTSAYGGSAITLKEGIAPVIQFGRVDGPIGFGPLDVSRAAHPDWKLERLTIRNCEVNTPSYCHFGWNVVGTLVQDITLRAVAAPVNHKYDLSKLKGACLKLDSTSSGKFVRVKFEGEKLVDDSNRANVKNWTFDGCTLNGKPLGLHGEGV